MPLYAPAAGQFTLTPAFNRFKAQSYEPGQGNSGTSFPLVSGVITLSKIPVGSAFLASNLSFEVHTAGATLTAAQSIAGLYDSAGNRLAQTADQSVAWTTTGIKSAVALASAVTVVPGPSGFIYAAFLSVGTTPPAFRHIASVALLNVGLAAGEFRAATIGSALTALPATLTLSTMTAVTGNSIYVSVN